MDFQTMSSEGENDLSMNSQALSSDEGSYLSNNSRISGGLLSSERRKAENNEPNRMYHQLPVLDVAPLNSVPYVGPPNPDDMFPSPTKEKTEAAGTLGPAMILLPSQATREELDNMMAATKFGVALTGSAATGSIGPVLGKMDIAETEDSFYFRVCLPGVSTDKKVFNFEIQPDGTVLIKGVSTTGEKVVCREFQIFHMLTQNLAPPGPFSIKFQLPGPVNPQELTSCFENGLFEVIVKRR